MRQAIPALVAFVSFSFLIGVAAAKAPTYGGGIGDTGYLGSGGVIGGDDTGYTGGGAGNPYGGDTGGYNTVVDHDNCKLIGFGSAYGSTEQEAQDEAQNEGCGTACVGSGTSCASEVIGSPSCTSYWGYFQSCHVSVRSYCCVMHAPIRE